jgi:type IV pilus biogenesis protein PilP
MRSFGTLLGLFASAVIAAEPSARIEPAPAAATTDGTASVTSVHSRTPVSGTTSGVSEQPSGNPPVQGERSRLEAEKQLLTLQVDIATLQRKLVDLQSPPRSMAAGAGPAAIPVEPAPTVLARRGFDGHFTAVLRMSTGGKLVVHAGDALPGGKVDAVDGQGVTVTWYGRRQRLLDAEAEEGNAMVPAHSLDLTLPPAPVAVTAR